MMNYNRAVYRRNARAPEATDAPKCDLSCADVTPRLALAYVKPQEWGDLLDAPQALAAGTLFRELDLPFAGSKCARGGAMR